MNDKQICKPCFLIKINKEIFFKNNHEEILNFEIKRLQKKFHAPVWLLDFNRKLKKSSKLSKMTLDDIKKIEQIIKKLPKNHSIFIIESINPMMDTNLIKEMNVLIQKETKNVVPFGAIPGTAPEIGLAKNNILPYLKNKNKTRNDAEIINWDTQGKANNQFNLKRPIRIKLFLGLVRKIKFLEKISIEDFLKILEKKENFNYLLDYCEEVDTKEIKQCPNCNSKNQRPIFFSSSQPTTGFLTSKIPIYYECLRCHLTYLRRQCSPKDLGKFYDAYERPKVNQKKLITDLINKRSGSHFNEKLIVAKILQDKVRNGSEIVDLGCGFGEFACLLKNTNPSWIVKAVDFNLEHIKSILYKNNVIPISKNFIEKFDLRSNAVTLLHVIEHIPFSELKKIISNISLSLKSGGILVITTPNSNSELAKLFDYHLMFPPIHQTIFSDTWLKEFIEKNWNFNLVEKKSASVILENFDGWFSYFHDNAPNDESQFMAKMFFNLKENEEKFEMLHKHINEKRLGSETILVFKKYGVQ